MTARSTRRWSQDVTRHSNALDLDKDVFVQAHPKRSARSLKHSADHSRRRKSSPFRSAMSMLNFDLNRAGGQLSALQRRRLERAKNELRVLYRKLPGARNKGSD